MRLSGKNELHGMIGVADDLSECLNVSQHEVGSFVGGESASEADGQRFGIKQRRDFRLFRVRQSQSFGTTQHAIPCEQDHAVLERLMCLPQFTWGDVFESRPDFGFTRTNVPLQWQHAVVQCFHLWREPTGDVYPVGNVSDRNFFLAASGPQTGPHPPTDNAVKIRDRIRPATALECQYSHAERFIGITGIDASKPTRPPGPIPN